MALGTKDFLSLSDEHDSDRSLPLNMLLCPLRVLCSGCCVVGGGHCPRWSAAYSGSFSPPLLLGSPVRCQQQLLPFSPACLVAMHPSSLCCLPSTHSYNCPQPTSPYIW